MGQTKDMTRSTLKARMKRKRKHSVQTVCRKTFIPWLHLCFQSSLKSYNQLGSIKRIEMTSVKTTKSYSVSLLLSAYRDQEKWENTAPLYSLSLAHQGSHPKPSCTSPSDTNIESLLGIRLLPKLSQEMAEQANYLTGSISHFKTCLWGTL